eukprot:1230052-Pyramimonas_sp.AAC.1
MHMLRLPRVSPFNRRRSLVKARYTFSAHQHHRTAFSWSIVIKRLSQTRVTRMHHTPTELHHAVPNKFTFAFAVRSPVPGSSRGHGGGRDEDHSSCMRFERRTNPRDPERAVHFPRGGPLGGGNVRRVRAARPPPPHHYRRGPNLQGAPPPTEKGF